MSKCRNAFFEASSRPPQHGTFMRTIVTDLMSFSRIKVTFAPDGAPTAFFLRERVK